MGETRYSIGIDLGTTNCALAFVALDTPSGRSEVLSIPQREELQTVVERSTLPSFLYLPPDGESAAADRTAFGLVDGWAVGLVARGQSARTPGRVAHSAKSWLANHTMDPAEQILPWRSELLDDDKKISPLAASAAFLSHLRAVWEAQFASRGPDHRFERQSITITVPASFDAAAQRATLDAAQLAGFPRNIRLVEEPQAAFYRYLESVGDTAGEVLRPGKHVLVVDIGGGTSDFSLFEVEAGDPTAPPQIKRVAVSEHILLGGDNIDLALAHVLEGELVPEGEELAGESWSHLLARSRELKERCLSGGADSEILHVAIPGRGSGLFSGTLSTSVPSPQVREILLEGFFPDCDRLARPDESQSALHEWGLPYASDFAVTRYLADFLREHPPVDAVLFNGGTLAAPLIRSRLIDQIARWQQGARPIVLENPEPFLAVARGAAHYGALFARKTARIEAGAARAIFLEVAGNEDLSLVCVLPRGAAPEEVFRANVSGLHLQVNQPVRFQAYQGAHQQNETAGTVLPKSAEGFAPLPPLESRADLEGSEPDRLVPVRIESRINELGLLQIELVSEDPEVDERWPLAFNLRGSAKTETAEERPPVTDPGVDAERLERAVAVIERTFGPQTRRQDERLTPARIFTKLERALGLSRQDWNLLLARQLADTMLAFSAGRHHSPDHAETWLHLTGFFMRPGFGHPDDDKRMDRLWNAIHPEGPGSDKRRELQALILWRRLAGGLSADRQHVLFAEIQAALTNKKAVPAEEIRLVGALERISPTDKETLSAQLITTGVSEATSQGYPAPYLSAAGLLLNRSPFYAGPDSIVPPEAVEAAFQQLKSLDWSKPELAEIIPLFLRAARLVHDPRLNVSSKVRRRIVDKLKKSGVAAARVVPLQEFVPVSRQDQALLYSESLPPGLWLG